MCIGRHPIQNPTMIKPEIGKLPKAVVNRIPLVMYIPPPPDALPTDGPIKIPEAAYLYPPKSLPASVAPKRRFRFLKSFKSKKNPSDTASPSQEATKDQKIANAGDPQTWEDHWEQEGYPFVVLEGNRAACAICLLDFEEPKRIGAPAIDEVEKQETEQELMPSVSTQVATIGVENITEEDRDEQIRLQDAGEGAQPLRLLACGHVFHVSVLSCHLQHTDSYLRSENVSRSLADRRLGEMSSLSAGC